MSDSKFDIHLISPTDEKELIRLSEKLGDPHIAKWFWEDRTKPTMEKLLLSFRLLFGNPFNMVIDLAGDGVLVLIDIVPGWRANLYAAVWGKNAARNRELQRTALAGAMTTLNLKTIDALIGEKNRSARLAARMVGFKERGSITGFMCYNGETMAAIWHELTRDNLGM